MADSLEDKAARLRSLVRSLDSVAVAFSGGVDSALLAKVCQDELPGRALAVTVRAQIHPRFEMVQAGEIARAIGIPHEVLEVDAFQIPHLAENPPDRCYHCKRAVFGRLAALAKERGFACVADGTNADDRGDFRPGARAVRELGVRSPLQEAGMTKRDIRELSRRLGLPTWDQPSLACLASRIPYGDPITEESLRRIDAAEDALRAAGYRQCRVRHHGPVARIEVPPEDIARLAAPGEREAVVEKLRALGYAYVALDLAGYRTGSLNEMLSAEQKGPA